MGTWRYPSGDPQGEITHLVLAELDANRMHTTITKEEAIKRAEKGELWCRSTIGGNPVEVIAEDRDRDGRKDYVKTKPDGRTENNLLHQDIWDQDRKRWLNWQGHPKAA